ncbi:MAG: transglutaminase domain-containing protein [Candidatus Altiarchaeota archaeon]|nr:transglutaminase domain-containing protein [Candidatus Altiarchaeota archaeon]
MDPKKTKAVFAIFLLGILSGNIWVETACAKNTVITPGIDREKYVIDEAGETLTFTGSARYGTPCYDEPHYVYRWESNNTGVIGIGDKFILGVNDPLIAPPGWSLPIRHTITLTVRDCVGAEAKETVELVVVAPLKAGIISPQDGASFDCLIELEGMISGGLAPYKVGWKTEKDGVIKEYVSETNGMAHRILTTPPLLYPVSSGVHKLRMEVTDSLGLKASDERFDISIGWCCAVNSTCKGYWPENDGKIICTANEESYSCDIYEVCHPKLWEKARKAVYCCENNCPAGCNEYCPTALEEGRMPGTDYESLKKCAGLYLIYGFGPAREYMEDYFWPELSCNEDPAALEECCFEDLGTCRCSWHRYNRNVLALPCTDYVSSSSLGWKSDIAMNVNTCKMADLPAHVSILDENDGGIHTGTCADYSNALTTMLRIVGFNIDEVYSVVGPGHAYNLVKFPGSVNWNIIDATGNAPNPYDRFGLPKTKYGYNYCMYADEIYCPGCVGINCAGGGCVDTWPRCCKNDVSIYECPQNTEVYGC